MPGDSGSATLTVQNNGTGQLRYAMDLDVDQRGWPRTPQRARLTITAGACPGAGAPLYNSLCGQRDELRQRYAPTPGGDQGDRVAQRRGQRAAVLRVEPAAGHGQRLPGSHDDGDFTFDAEQTADN